ncbi:MAG: thiosulfate sulfurtransferase [Betaproteobacteria bacterium]|nr:thiosulfate sulfurtransferase [Betaproteobacteria bacterium]
MLEDGGELALLDVREEGVFSHGHLLFAVPLPLSRLEERLPLLVPRTGTRIVLCDGDDGLADRAAARMTGFGYKDVRGLRGGIAAWKAAGYHVFSGVNVPSKAFGELVEEHCKTPRMEAAEVKRRIADGEDMIILDSRPMREFRNMSIPGGIDCPGAELVYRAPGLIPTPDTLVVVNCAGRTRSIIGAQSLINAGLPNRVVALKNGTMGWELAGFELARGHETMAPSPTGTGLATTRAMAADVARRFGLRRIGRAELDRFRGEADQRTLYIFDVRTPEEFNAGHIAGATSAPGGQLVQATDGYIGTRNARVVLVDDAGVRAVMTASWLVQMGMPDVYVLEESAAGGELVAGSATPVPLGLAQVQAETVTPAELAQLLQDGAAVLVDIGSSLQFRDAHIPGAHWGIRSRFPENLGKLQRSGLLVITSPDGIAARLAAADAAAVFTGKVQTLAGGTAAWRAEKRPLASGFEPALDAPDDVWHGPYSPFSNTIEAKRQYLSWEVDLLSSMEAEPGLRFQVVPAQQEKTNHE